MRNNCGSVVYGKVKDSFNSFPIRPSPVIFRIACTVNYKYILNKGEKPGRGYKIFENKQESVVHFKFWNVFWKMELVGFRPSVFFFYISRSPEGAPHFLDVTDETCSGF